MKYKWLGFSLVLLIISLMAHRSWEYAQKDKKYTHVLSIRTELAENDFKLDKIRASAEDKQKTKQKNERYPKKPSQEFLYLNALISESQLDIAYSNVLSAHISIDLLSKDEVDHENLIEFLMFYKSHLEIPDNIKDPIKILEFGVDKIRKNIQKIEKEQNRFEAVL